jgi:transcriptional antiterminator RfaH
MQKKKWHALYTRPRYEKKVEKMLRERRIDCYLPLIKTLRQWSDRKKMVEIPLFASYIFVHVDEHDYNDVFRIPGVVKYISFEGTAVEIPEKQIENIRWVLSTDIKAEPLEAAIPMGSRVEIVKGPLTGLKAEMVTYNNKNIILVRVDQLNKSFMITIPAGHVKIV